MCAHVPESANEQEGYAKEKKKHTKKQTTVSPRSFEVKRLTGNFPKLPDLPCPCNSNAKWHA